MCERSEGKKTGAGEAATRPNLPDALKGGVYAEAFAYVLEWEMTPDAEEDDLILGLFRIFTATEGERERS